MKNDDMTSPRMSYWTLLIFVLFIPIPRLDAKLVRGHLLTGDNWKFLARFCFLSMHGKFEYDVMYDASYGVQNIDLYYDTASQWARVYGDKADLTNCKQKESVLKVENNQFINLTEKMVVSGCTLVNNSLTSTKYIHCKGSRNFNTARDRWWFVAISNCESTKGLQLSYKFLMTNGPKHDILHHHFSADEFYLLPILLTSAVIHLLLLFMSIWSAIVLKTRHLFHATYKLFMVVIAMHCIGTMFLSAHYLVYGIDGIGLEGTHTAGRVLEAAAEQLFVLLLLLIAKGYTVTRARLPQASSIKLAIFLCCFSITYSALFIYENVHFDPGQVLYIYESLAGYGLIILRGIGWCMFIYSTFFTLKHYPEKGGFYYPYFSFYTLWFVSGPCMIIIANHIIDEWIRQKVVVSVEHFITVCGHLVFLLLTRPAAHNKNFPYHVRTTQIGIMEAMTTNTSLGPNTLDRFANGGTYGVSAATSMDIFTVDSTSRPMPPPPPPPYSSYVPNGIPRWSITNHTVPPVIQNGDGGNPSPKIYDPNEDDSD